MRAKQDQINEPDAFSVLPILMHGDAAFAGQGVVAETLNLSDIKGYRVGGTIHLVINNQLGFTTPPEAARSGFYSTDVAKMVQAPIFHVNGDDPEACVRVARLAFEYRQRFHKDVVIDIVCYRRYGHNEGDDPSYTQPLMYAKIDERRSVRKLYTESLVKRGHSPRGGRAGARRLPDAAAAGARGDPPVRAAVQPARRRAAAAGRRACRRSTTGVDRADARPHLRRAQRLARRLQRPPQAGQAVRDPRHDGPRGGRGRLGHGRGAGVRVAAARGHRHPRSPARTRAAARSASATRCWSTTPTAPSGPRWPTSGPSRRKFWIYDSLLSEYAGARASSTATRWPTRTRSCAGRRSSATSSNGARSSSTSTSSPPRTSGARRRASCCCCRTATRARAPSTARPASSASSRCAPRTTSRSSTPRRPRSTSTCCGGRCTATCASRWSCSRPSRCCGPRPPGRRRRARRRALPRGARRPPRRRPGRGAPHRAVLGQGRPRGAGRARQAGGPVAVVRVEQLYPWPHEQLRRDRRPLPERPRDRVAAGGAGEHGRVVLRAGPPGRALRRHPHRAAGEPVRVGQSRPPGRTRSTCRSKRRSSTRRSASAERPTRRAGPSARCSAK